MFTWAARHVPAAIKSGLDYVLISYDDDACHGLQPDWQRVFNRLGDMFPNAKLGFGAVGTTVTAQKEAFINRYYRLQINHPRFVGGYFWRYFNQDMVPWTAPLWRVLDDAMMASVTAPRPTLAITAPADGDILAGTTVPVLYMIEGDVSEVDHVYLQLDGEPGVREPDLDGSYDFAEVPAGEHVLQGYLVRADDSTIMGTDITVEFATEVGAPAPGDLYTRLTPSWVPGTRLPWFFSQHQHGTLGTQEPLPDLYEICTIRVSESADGRFWSEIFADELPAADDVVCIPEAVGVTFDLTHNPPFRAVAIKGMLQFAPTVSTQMTVGTIQVYKTGTLEMIPESASITTEVIFTGRIDTKEDPGQLTIGLVADGGMVTIMGAPAPATRWTRTVNAPAGARQITVEDATGWQAGDEVHLADTQTGVRLRYDFFFKRYEPQHEVHTISAIAGNQVTLADPLQFHHDGYIANVRRNIVLRSDLSGGGPAGHIFLAGHCLPKVAHTAIYEMGRSTVMPRHDTTYDEDGQVLRVGSNQRGRYALHAHHVHEPVTFQGNAIVMPVSRFGIVAHDSLVHILDNTVIGAQGSGIFGEDGVEYGDVKRNLVIGTGNGLTSMGQRGIYRVSDDSRFAQTDPTGEPYRGQDLGFGTHGFWFRGPLMRVEDNIAAGAFNSSAYTYFTHPAFVAGLVPDIPGMPDELRGQRIKIDDIYIGLYGSFKRNHLEGIFGEGGIRLNYSSPISPATNQLHDVTMKLHAENGIGLRTTHGRNHTLFDPVWLGGGGDTAIKRNNGDKSHVYVKGNWRFENFADLCHPDPFCTFD